MHAVIRRVDLLAGEDAQVGVDSFKRPHRLKRWRVLPVVGQRHEIQADLAAGSRHVGRRFLAVRARRVHVQVAAVGPAAEQVILQRVQPEVKRRQVGAFDEQDIFLFAFKRAGDAQRAVIAWCNRQRGFLAPIGLACQPFRRAQLDADRLPGCKAHVFKQRSQYNLNPAASADNDRVDIVVSQFFFQWRILLNIQRAVKKSILSC